jgi:hypothetical protein
MEEGLKHFWKGYFKLNWKFGLFLVLIICIPRFVLVLNANETGNYSFIGIIMFISAIIPFIFLNKYGRKQIGISRTNKLYISPQKNRAVKNKSYFYNCYGKEEKFYIENQG